MMQNYIPEPVFQWTRDNAVGIEDIDREHQRLFSLAERMHQAMLAGRGREFLPSLLAGLISYTADHLSREERLMERIGYPGLAEHRRQHAELRANVRALQARSASGETTMTIEATQLLMEWLKRHATASDRRIGEYLTTRDQRR